jgi:hypothetical protein
MDYQKETDARIVIDGLLRKAGWDPADKSMEAHRLAHCQTVLEFRIARTVKQSLTVQVSRGSARCAPPSVLG